MRSNDPGAERRYALGEYCHRQEHRRVGSGDSFGDTPVALDTAHHNRPILRNKMPGTITISAWGPVITLVEHPTLKWLAAGARSEAMNLNANYLVYSAAAWPRMRRPSHGLLGFRRTVDFAWMGW